MRSRIGLALVLSVAALTVGCSNEQQVADKKNPPASSTKSQIRAGSAERSDEASTRALDRKTVTVSRTDASFKAATVTGAPERFTIIPDDYHVQWAGTAEDGRRFFLSAELFDIHPDGQSAWVGLYLWKADGTFDEIRVTRVGIDHQEPTAAHYQAVIDARLAELGDFTLETIEVEPFTVRTAGVTFGWEVDSFEGELSIVVLPGDFIAYYAPWDGVDYDT